MNLFPFPFILYWTEVIYYYKSYLPLFAIIMKNLILYQKSLNERRRTIYIFSEFLYSNFETLPFTWSALFCLKFPWSTFISLLYLFLCAFVMLKVCSISPKEMTKLFSGLAGSFPNTSSSFSVHCLFRSFSFRICSHLSSRFLW